MGKKIRTVRVGTVALEGAGPVKLVWKRGTRSMRLSIRPFQGIVLSLPDYVSQADAEKWLATKLGWMRKNLVKNGHTEGQLTVFSPDKPFVTRHHRLQITRTDGPELCSRVTGGVIRVQVPCALPVESKQVQLAIRGAVVRALRKEAEAYLPQRVKLLAQTNGFRVGNIQLRDNLSRWGSCSARGNISLNIHLMRLPQNLVDYVILHELVHTLHHNHGHRFREHLDRLTGGAGTAERELRKYHTQIF